MKFTYTALNKDGRKESGTIDAPTSTVAGHLLKEQGLSVTELSSGKAQLHLDIFGGFQGVPLKEKLVFIEDLSLMLKSGISVARSLHVLSKQTHNKKFAKVIESLNQDVENGQSLHEAMAKHPKVFANIFISMIKIGELGGNLDQSLKYLSVQLEREADLRSHVRGAMIYPSVIIIAMIIIGVVMGIFVLPKLTVVFKDFGTELPPLTKAVIFIGDFMSAHAVIVVLGLLIAAAGLVFGIRTPAGKSILDVVLVRAPILSPLVQKINIARFSRVMSSLLQSGIPIVEALKISGESMPNSLYNKAISESAETVKVGKSLTDTMGKYEHLFPFIMVQMLQIGEETGNIESILSQLAEHYETEVDLTLKNISSIIEPLLLLVIGGIVGVLAYALVVPIYNIGSSIQ